MAKKRSGRQGSGRQDSSRQDTGRRSSDRRAANQQRSRSDRRRSADERERRSAARQTVRNADRQRPRREQADLRDDEEMLAEFSDETNDFYVDELRERRQNARGRKQDTPKEPKQKQRKPLSPTRRKLIRILSYGAIVSIVLVVGVILSLTVLFKTQVFEVSGVTKYTEDAIEDASGISLGENIFLAPKHAAANRIKEKFPYVEDAEVSFKIPDTIRISVVEAVEGYLVKVSDTDYLVISTKGRILDQVADSNAYDLPIFIGPTPLSGAVGDYVSYEDKRVVDMIESITQTFADNGYQGITEIDATNTADISFTYENRVKVKLGIPEDLDYKIRTAMTIINENLDKNQTGTIQGILDVSRCNSTKRSYFNEQEIAPTVAATEQPTGISEGSGEDSGDYDSYYDEDDYDWYEDDDYDSYDYDSYDGDGYYE